MFRYLKKAIVSTADRCGYTIRRKPTGLVDKEFSHFENCLHLLMGFSESINIVQVGANDGAINDPLYAFISKFPSRSRVILVEPQSQLIHYLEQNYKFHEEKYIFNGAIGPSGQLKLYTVRRDCWGDIDVRYAKGWPEYRAPTGVTSTSCEHVASWISKYYKGKLPTQDVIETITVETIEMETLLRRANLFDKIDVLQVDAEGFDDKVIYASNIPEYLPFIINFELSKLSARKARTLKYFLADHGYIVSQHGIDGLAVRVIPTTNTPKQMCSAAPTIRSNF